MVICMLPPTAKCDVIYSTRSSSKVNHPEARKEPETVHLNLFPSGVYDPQMDELDRMARNNWQ